MTEKNMERWGTFHYNSTDFLFPGEHAALPLSSTRGIPRPGAPTHNGAGLASPVWLWDFSTERPVQPRCSQPRPCRGELASPRVATLVLMYRRIWGGSFFLKSCVMSLSVSGNLHCCCSESGFIWYWYSHSCFLLINICVVWFSRL